MARKVEIGQDLIIRVNSIREFSQVMDRLLGRGATSLMVKGETRLEIRPRPPKQPQLKGVS